MADVVYQTNLISLYYSQNFDTIRKEFAFSKRSE